MLIGIDGNEANEKERVGVHIYTYELLWGFYKISLGEKTPNKFTIYLKENPREDLPKENSFWRYKIIKGKGLWVLRKLMPALYKNPRPAVFFTPTHYLPPFSPMPEVCTIHDLGYLNFSGQFRKLDFWQLKYWTAISLFVSKYIIAVSNSTRKDIVRRYPFTSKKVTVVYHGYDSSRFNTKISDNFVRQVKTLYGIPGEYILFLSTLKPSKNIEGLLEGFNLIKDKFPDYKLVIAGKKGWFYDSIFQKVRILGLEDKVVFTDYVSEENKPALIYGAKIFACPSFWEGFGIDILNSLACGTPVIVSNVASLPEVAGKAGIYVDPYVPKSIANALTKILNMNNMEYNSLIKLGIRQASQFSWEKTSRETLSLIQKTA